MKKTMYVCNVSKNEEPLPSPTMNFTKKETIDEKKETHQEHPSDEQPLKLPSMRF